ncbi:MAG: ftsA 1 [Firmicutes bacterium]|nr:ftsA 1 [Bacillota bacterium]
MDKNVLFALDIGTRSVVGLIGEKTANGIKVLAMDRQEHHTRAMLDGQIHDVPEVAHVLAAITSHLADIAGPLKRVSVAAAGRALCTLKAVAEIETINRGSLSPDDERALELAAIQNAQHQLATGKQVADPASYYCVGHNIIRFTLDGTPIKSLIGQRGKIAAIEVIATFLPRQVIDSMQSAIEAVGLEMATLTLEPIAAINVLIPPTMRHLNIALVDVGAGTSDVAITKDGSVIGFGMVPCAGDEITEALSQAYLLDFNVAELIKRQLNSKSKKILVPDILGQTNKISAAEITSQIKSAVNELAKAIASQILTLNNAAPQAVLLVGGGSLTPDLPEAVANALGIAPSRVAIRRPEVVDGLEAIPDELCAPDGVTPLGILKLASSQTLNFVNVTVNTRKIRLFNLGKLSVADALLAAGIEIRSLHGRPGLGITITVNDQKHYLPGTLGQAGYIMVNNAKASFNDLLTEHDEITVHKGVDGLSPTCMIKDIVSIPQTITVTVNGTSHNIEPVIEVNGKPATPDSVLADRSEAVCYQSATLAEVLTHCGVSFSPLEHHYTVNDVERTYRQLPDFIVNGKAASLATVIEKHDIINVNLAPLPTLAELLGMNEENTVNCTVTFNGSECSLPLRRQAITIDGKPAKLNDTAAPGSTIDCSYYEIKPIVSDVLLAAKFDPHQLSITAKIELRVNNEPAEYTTPVKNGDQVEITACELSKTI